MNRILVIQTAFLGDVILATPVVSELKRLFPDAEIDFCLKKGNESLLVNNPDLREIFVFNKKEGKLKSIIQLIRKFRSNNYDLVINLHRFGSSGILAGLSKGKRRYGFRKNPFSFMYTKSFDHEIGDGTHEVTRNLSLIREFGAKEILRPSLYPSEADELKVSNYKNSTYIVIAPASVWFTKQLPVHKWLELLSTIENDLKVYLIGSKDDSEICKQIKKGAPDSAIEILAGELSLLESAALMKDASHCYVNDSGPLHIASSVNAKVTAIFCSTIPEFGFGPLSDDSSITQVEELACRPCGLHGHKECPKGHFKCAEDIQF